MLHRASASHCPFVQTRAAGSLSPEEITTAAAILGYGGVKYFDLRQNRGTDYEFSYERMLNPDGDTAVYLEVCVSPSRLRYWAILDSARVCFNVAVRSRASVFNLPES